MLFGRKNFILYEEASDQGGNQQTQTSGDATANKDTSQGSDNKSTPTIDWSKIDITQIPADVIKKSPVYKEVLDESINRRKQIKDIKSKINAEDDGETPPAKKEPVSTQTPTDDLAKQLETLTKLVTGLVTKDVAANKEVVGTKFGLSKEQAGFITGNTVEEMEASAKQIATTFGIKPPASGAGASNPGSGVDDGLVARLKAKVTGSDTMSNPFDPGVQRMTGGGARI